MRRHDQRRGEMQRVQGSERRRQWLRRSREDQALEKHEIDRFEPILHDRKSGRSLLRRQRTLEASKVAAVDRPSIA